MEEFWIGQLMTSDTTLSLESQSASLYQKWMSRLRNITFAEIGRPSSLAWVLSALRKGDLLCPNQMSNDILSKTSNDVNADCCATFVDLLRFEVIPNFEQSGSPMWGDVNRITIRHPVLGDSPISCLFDESFPISGSYYTVRPGNDKWGQSVGMIFDMSDLDKSVYSFPGGDSEQISDPSSRSMIGPWREGKYTALIPNFGNDVSTTLIMRLRPKR